MGLTDGLYFLGTKTSVRTSTAATLLICVGLASLLGATSRAQIGGQRDELKGEIARLEQELQQLRNREGGVLDQIERLSAELALSQAQRRQVTRQLEESSQRVDALTARLTQLESDQDERKRYLAFRLRETYKAGAAEPLRRALGEGGGADYWDGLRYANFLSGRDRRVLDAFRESRRETLLARDAQISEQIELDRLESQLVRRRQEIKLARARQSRVLDEIRQDQSRRASAISELSEAVDAMGNFVQRLDSDSEPNAAESLDILKFRGLLDWPAQGKVRDGFGTVVHPRFKTRIPHPGIDIDAKSGAPIFAIFGGTVAFSGWMRGYGLTTIIDHGGGVHSVYAHASVAWTEAGERIAKGEKIALVGETGSLRGAGLYFEIRQEGRAVDPKSWLRPK